LEGVLTHTLTDGSPLLVWTALEFEDVFEGLLELCVDGVNRLHARLKTRATRIQLRAKNFRVAFPFVGLRM
jgi:hypothetical protein